MRYLSDKFMKNIENDLNSSMSLRVTLFICFVILLLLIYLFFWVPLFVNLNAEV